MYKFLIQFETSIAADAGKYDYENNDFQNFLHEYQIDLKPVTQTKRVVDLPKNNYIVFLYGDHREKYDDKAHDLLRHIRNSISHALIHKTETKRVIFDITDRNRNKATTLRGNIDGKLFFALIEQLISTHI